MLQNVLPYPGTGSAQKFCGDYSIRIAHAYLGHIQQQWAAFIHRDFPSTITIINIISSEILTEDDETISNTESQTSLSEESTIEQPTSEESMNEESTNVESETPE
ncbi:unnamed protein product [Didymodactylos carnosus]|uniref:Uncharacterized protein n=1 Tax=Didymodactylos carnosus TaxID=1234261 RepID=A0A815Q0G2_9BILA|nr:unnamed protein product [Didymodactylos carnosus]CAF4328163.1 unnamed protein product [Didymodactylos carnosus]